MEGLVLLKKIILLSLIVIIGGSSDIFASGYRVPEQSLNSSALSSAYVANANGPDAAYFNPANMSWGAEGWEAEGGFSFIHLPSINYNDNRNSAFDGNSEKEYFVIPNFFTTSPEVNGFRFGFAMVSPAGLSKRWKDPYPKTFAEESSMIVLEANPSISYRFNDKFSVGLGARLIYSDATVKSDGTIIIPAESMGTGMPPADLFVSLTRDMDGDTIEFGYNVAMSYRPVKELALAATYRSQIDLDMDGDVTLTSDVGPNYNGSGSVTIPIPDVLSLAAAYTFENITLEFTYDRTFWSAYDELDFEYPQDLGNPILTAAFDDPVAKDWDDVNAYRIGLTYLWNENLSLMFGGGIDGNPIPDRTLTFDLPDSDAWFASLGFRYKHNEKLSYGAAYLYADKDSRSVTNDTVDGDFSGASTHLVASSLTYLF
jgi:long-chain fatty acid transport protein